MFQKYIKIKNFRAVKDIKINFSKGINLINGANASGKSSIIMALVFMKFNWMKYNLDKCINDTTKLGYFEIEEEFEKNNTRFYQKYIYKNGKGTRELTINNKEFFKNTDAVNKLKEFFDPDLLRPSMIYMQKEAGAIEISSSARREFFKKIFNLIFKEQLLILETETKEYENQYDTLDKEAYLLDNYNYDYKTLKNIELSKEDILILEKEITFFKNEINKLNNEKIDLTEKNKEIEKLTSTINTKKTLIFDLDKKIKTYENEISKWEGELYQDFEKEIKSNETLLECLNDNVIKELEYKLSNIKLLRIGIFDETKLNETVNSYYDIQSSLNELRKSFKLLKSGKCPTCKKEFVTNDIKSWEELIKSKEVILNEILVLKEKLEAEKEKNINDKKELDADINKKSLLSKDIELEKSKLEANKKSLLNKIESERRLITQKKDNISNNLRNSQNNKTSIILQKEQIEKDIRDLEESLSKMSVSSLGKIDSSLNEYTIILQQKESLLNVINTNLILNKDYINHNNKLDLVKKSNSVKLKKLDKNKKNLIKEIEINKTSKTILQKEFPNYVINTLINAVQKDMNSFISYIYREMNIQIVENNDKIDITYDEANRDVSLCSGFEKEIASLGWMYGLGKLQDNDMLILDEADSSADEENSQLLHKTLLDLDDCWNQIILVTHRNDTKEMLINNKATVFEISNGKVIAL